MRLSESRNILLLTYTQCCVKGGEQRRWQNLNEIFLKKLIFKLYSIKTLQVIKK